MKKFFSRLIWENWERSSSPTLRNLLIWRAERKEEKKQRHRGSINWSWGNRGWKKVILPRLRRDRPDTFLWHTHFLRESFNTFYCCVGISSIKHSSVQKGLDVEMAAGEKLKLFVRNLVWFLQVTWNMITAI